MSETNVPLIIARCVIVFLLLWILFKSMENDYVVEEDFTIIVKPQDQDCEYKDNVYLVKGNNYSIDDTTITLKGLKPKLVVGDILIGDEAPGFLRRIISIEIKGNSRVFTTENIDILDVIKSGGMSSLYSMVPSDATTESMNNQYKSNKPILFKASHTSKALRSMQEYNFIISKKKGTSYNLPFTTGTLDMSKLSSKLRGSAVIDGNLSIIPSVIVTIDIGFTGINEFTTVLNIDINGSIHEKLKIANASNTVDTNWSKKLSLSKGEISICTGVWITVTPDISLAFSSHINFCRALICHQLLLLCFY
jgi:hypothetical protein